MILYHVHAPSFDSLLMIHMHTCTRAHTHTYKHKQVSTMELDLLVGQLSMCESVEWSESQMEGAAREVHLAALMASSE